MLEGRRVITPAQTAIMRAFSEIPDSDRFYLAGGTALAEFYLGHRKSYDLDFFTATQGLVLPFSHAVETAFHEQGIMVKLTRRFHSFVELLCITEGGLDQAETRLQLAYDSPFRFAEPIQTDYGILVDDYEDLIVAKLLAFYGRWTHRDAVDLYFILRREDSHQLFEQARKKDPGFDLYWLAVALKEVARFPDQLEEWDVSMLVPLNVGLLKQAFRNLSDRILGGITGRA